MNFIRASYELDKALEHVENEPSMIAKWAIKMPNAPNFGETDRIC